MRNTPESEHDITVTLVRGLLRDQHPDLADLDLRLVANGWDEAIFRLGPDLAVRAPRRGMAADSSLADPAREARALGEFCAALHVPGPVDAPVNRFRGGHGCGLRRRFRG